MTDRDQSMFILRGMGWAEVFFFFLREHIFFLGYWARINKGINTDSTVYIRDSIPACEIIKKKKNNSFNNSLHMYIYIFIYLFIYLLILCGQLIGSVTRMARTAPLEPANDVGALARGRFSSSTLIELLRPHLAGRLQLYWVLLRSHR